ncbi:thioredoxin family protein [Cyclobacterium marinum]|mgnify:FL=1|uniref:Thioredoxin domain-containing protein n=1 Tax=Cyclobacterium marinum (strain ATCC 25205 / DSM 745 / LMG 13164 / NCIMB 1802) TaxID=880070 RepID=G0IUR8_CYCMS|nr:thioredoxin family protein [Cyclobacterium marinum]AEL25460.1 Thioredoxin domain-containing protein [Cyclobacterium marinum DSM 745]MBI0400900.1 thioredoxin family protein [Cyclobacterium marinum]
MLQELESDNLGQVIKDNDKVVVQFGATWCGNCRIMKPKMKRLSKAYEGVTFLYVDAEKLPESRKLAEVNNLPTFAVFEGGSLKNQIQTNKEEALKTLIDEVANN